MNVRIGIIGFSILYSASLWAATATEHCPLISSIRYDVKSAQYQAHAHNGVVWQSAAMAALDTAPAGNYLGISANGSRDEATVACSYKIGNNPVVLKGNGAFALGKGWQTISSPSGTVFYLCAKDKNCEFHHVQG